MSRNGDPTTSIGKFELQIINFQFQLNKISAKISKHSNNTNIQQLEQLIDNLKKLLLSTEIEKLKILSPDKEKNKIMLEEETPYNYEDEEENKQEEPKEKQQEKKQSVNIEMLLAQAEKKDNSFCFLLAIFNYLFTKKTQNLQIFINIFKCGNTLMNDFFSIINKLENLEKKSHNTQPQPKQPKSFHVSRIKFNSSSSSLPDKTNKKPSMNKELSATLKAPLLYTSSNLLPQTIQDLTKQCNKLIQSIYDLLTNQTLLNNLGSNYKNLGFELSEQLIHNQYLQLCRLLRLSNLANFINPFVKKIFKLSNIGDSKLTSTPENNKSVIYLGILLLITDDMLLKQILQIDSSTLPEGNNLLHIIFSGPREWQEFFLNFLASSSLNYEHSYLLQSAMEAKNEKQRSPHHYLNKSEQNISVLLKAINLDYSDDLDAEDLIDWVAVPKDLTEVQYQNPTQTKLLGKNKKGFKGFSFWLCCCPKNDIDEDEDGQQNIYKSQIDRTFST